MKKIFISCFVLGLSLVALSIPTAANASALEEQDIVTTTDLEANGTRSESPVIDENGEYLGKIVVEEEASPQARGLIYNEAVKNKNYNVHFIGVTANVGFGITVKNKNITRAYDAWSNGLIWDVSTNKLTRTNKEAKLTGRASFGVKGYGFNSSFRLRAVISGNQLLTYLDV